MISSLHTTISLARPSFCPRPSSYLDRAGGGERGGRRKNVVVVVVGVSVRPDAALLTGVILTPNWRIDVDPVETL